MIIIFPSFSFSRRAIGFKYLLYCFKEKWEAIAEEGLQRSGGGSCHRLFFRKTEDRSLFTFSFSRETTGNSRRMPNV